MKLKVEILEHGIPRYVKVYGKSIEECLEKVRKENFPFYSSDIDYIYDYAIADWEVMENKKKNFEANNMKRRMD